jgi:hypothetical protein
MPWHRVSGVGRAQPHSRSLALVQWDSDHYEENLKAASAVTAQASESIAGQDTRPQYKH